MSSIQRKWRHSLLRLASSQRQHPRTLSDSRFASHRRHYRMVDGKASPKSFQTSSSLGIIRPDLANSLQRFLRQWHLRVWEHRSHTMCRPSKPSSSSMHQLLTSSATTNQLWRLGPPPHHRYVAVKDGKDIRRF